MERFILHRLKPKVLISNTTDPSINLAVEEYLLHALKADEAILFLWQNDNTVVIGRNQNPWKECDYNKLEADGGTLVRRLSGGGAVYHDLGNLNYTILSKKRENSIDENINIIIDALSAMGIDAVFSGKNDILADDMKISGNAYYEEENKLCHHGTLLINANMNKLSHYLLVSKLKLQSKGIDSVKSRVKNLIEIDDAITVERAKQALIKAFFNKYRKGEIQIIDDVFIDSAKTFVDKYQSWDWNFGSSPEFNISLENRFKWGGFELNLLVKDGIIKEASVYTDALNTQLSQLVVEKILNQPLKSEMLIKALNEIDITEFKDITNWLSKQNL